MKDLERKSERADLLSSDSVGKLEAHNQRVIGEVFQTFRNRGKRGRPVECFHSPGTQSLIRRLQDDSLSELSGAIKSKTNGNFLNSGNFLGILPDRLYPLLKLFEVRR